MTGQKWGPGHKSTLWFDLKLQTFRSDWIGKLVVGWPPPPRSWWRRAERNEFPVISILEDSALEGAVPDWTDISLTWSELAVLPMKWRSALSQWRGVYYIFDASVGRGYVGSAYGNENLYGRWLNYSESGHGGNKLLKGRDPKNFQFSILQRVSPDMEADEVISVEKTWKKRLHTHAPDGLNEN